MPVRSKDLVIIGDIFCDIIALDVKLPDKWGVDILSKEIKVMAGGSALNITLHGANYSSHLDDAVNLRFFSSTGDDLQGQVCRDALQHPCVDSSSVLIRKGSRTGSCIVLSGSDDRSFITDRGCMKELSTGFFNKKDMLSSSTGHIHIGGYYNCDKLRTDALELLKNARQKSITTSLNPQYDATGGWDGIQELCPYLTFFIANNGELTSICKVEESADLSSTAGILLDLGCDTVVVTMGNEGAIAFRKQSNTNESGEQGDRTDEISVIVVAAPDVDVVDTTGAGDAFTGGFLVDWMVSHQVQSASVSHQVQSASVSHQVQSSSVSHRIQSALRAGCIAGGASVTQVGGSSYSIESLKLSELSLS